MQEENAEAHPDPAHLKSSSGYSTESDSDIGSSLGDPVDSDCEVPEKPHISIPNNTISAKITFEVPNPNGPGTKTIDFPLNIDLTKPPRNARGGRPPTYEVNIPVVMSNIKMQEQEMSRDHIDSPPPVAPSPESVPRRESEFSMCSFNAWSYATCCQPRPAAEPALPEPARQEPLSDEEFQTVFELHPNKRAEASLKNWTTGTGDSGDSKRPPGVPPISGIKSIDVRAGPAGPQSPSTFVSAHSLLVEDVGEVLNADRKDSGKKLDSDILKPIGPESYSQQGFPRLPVSSQVKSSLYRPKGFDQFNPRSPTWERAKSLASPGRTGGYGETAVDVIPETVAKAKHELPAVKPKNETQGEVSSARGPPSARRPGSGAYIVEGITSVGRKISEGLQNIARKLTFTPASEIPVPEGDDPLAPGIGWVPRPDEVGEGVKTIPELKQMLDGVWVRDPEKSDDSEPALDCMEMPWLMKRAVLYANQTEIKVYDDKIHVTPKLFGLSAPQESYFGREGRIQGRRDRRKGPSRIALVPTKTGVRQYNQWGEPYRGISLMEIDLAEDKKTLISKVIIKRKTGQNATVRTVMYRKST